MINLLIEQVVAKLGIDSTVAEKAVGIVMGILQDKGDAGAVQALFDKLPGAAELAGQHAEIAQSGGGLMGKLGGMLGGNAGEALEAMSAFKETGLSMDQAKELLPVAKGFMEEHAGTELNALLDSVPALKGLLD